MAPQALVDAAAAAGAGRAGRARGPRSDAHRAVAVSRLLATHGLAVRGLEGVRASRGDLPDTRAAHARLSDRARTSRLRRSPLRRASDGPFGNWRLDVA